MKPILVAGIGNIFCGDDAFGVEVVRCLSSRSLPQGVDVIDFGIRGIDLAYALTSHYSVAILVDAAQRGESPGTISVVEPENDSGSDEVMASAHDLDPIRVLRLASNLERACEKILLVVCEPLTLGGEDGVMGLSEPVAAAVDPAAHLIERLVESFLCVGHQHQTCVDKIN
jgi:hydrogenase maturation protease